MAEPQGSVHGQPQQSGQQQPPGSVPVIQEPTVLPPVILPPGYNGIVVGHVGGVGGVRRNRGGWREWRRADPTLINSLWKSKMGHGIRSQLGNAEVYIILALLIGLVTVVIGCWLSDNCWSPEPDHVVTTIA